MPLIRQILDGKGGRAKQHFTEMIGHHAVDFFWHFAVEGAPGQPQHE